MPWPTRLIEFNGKCQSLNAWAREIGIGTNLLHYRLSRWSVEDALTISPFAQHTVIDKRMVDAIEAARPDEVKVSPYAYRFLLYKGKSLPLGEWARITGIPRITLTMRLKLGWPIERALTTVVKKRSSNKRKRIPIGGGRKLSSGVSRPAGEHRSIKNRIGS